MLYTNPGMGLPIVAVGCKPTDREWVIIFCFGIQKSWTPKSFRQNPKGLILLFNIHNFRSGLKIPKKVVVVEEQTENLF